MKLQDGIFHSIIFQFSSVIHSCMTLWPHRMQHTTLPCPSPTTRASSNSCPLSQCCHPTISFSVVPLSACPLRLSQHQGLFKWVSSSHQVAKLLELQLSISPFNEYSRLVSFRDWLAVQGTQESSPMPQFKSMNSSAFSFLYCPTLASICNYWKNHSFD